MTTQYPEAIKGEKVWVDYDEDTALWCVFGLTSGHAYSTHVCQQDAVDQILKDRKAAKH